MAYHTDTHNTHIYVTIGIHFITKLPCVNIAKNKNQMQKPKKKKPPFFKMSEIHITNPEPVRSTTRRMLNYDVLTV